MSNYTKLYNITTNPAKIRPNDEADLIAKIGKDLDGLIAAFNATDTDVSEIETAYEVWFKDLELGSWMEGDATNTVAFLGPSTTPILDMANGDTDSSLEITWAASNNDPIIRQLALPPDIDPAEDLVLHFRGKMGGSTDTPTLAGDFYLNEGDTKVEAASSAFGAAFAENTITISAADITAGDQTLTIELTPGAHTTDTMVISAFWLEGARAVTHA